jgi:hypothetical protein
LSVDVLQQGWLEGQLQIDAGDVDGIVDVNGNEDGGFRT